MPEELRSADERADEVRRQPTHETRRALREALDWPRPCPPIEVGDATVEVFSSPSLQRIIYVHRSPGQVCVVDNQYLVLCMGESLPSFTNAYTLYEVADLAAMEMLREQAASVAEAVDIERKRKAGLLPPPSPPEMPAPAPEPLAVHEEEEAAAPVAPPAEPPRKRAAAPKVHHAPTHEELEWDRRFGELFAAARALEIAAHKRDPYLKPSIRRQTTELFGPRPSQAEHQTEHPAPPRKKRPPRKKKEPAATAAEPTTQVAAEPVPVGVPEPPVVVEAPAEPVHDPSRPLFGPALYASLFPEASKKTPKDALACVARFGLAALITVRELHAAAVTAQQTVNAALQQARRNPKKQLVLPDGRTFSEAQLESLLSVANGRVGDLAILAGEIEKLDKEE